MTATCPEVVFRGQPYHERREACGKPVRRRGLCGIHANQADRSDANRAREEAMRERYRQRDLAESQAVNIACLLTDRYGISFTTDGQGNIRLASHDCALALLNRKDPT